MYYCQMAIETSKGEEMQGRETSLRGLLWNIICHDPTQF